MITKDEVKKLANLSRLTLQDDEIDNLSEQMSQIMDYVKKLDELDLKDIKPTAHAVEVQNVFRDTEDSRVSGIIDKAILNAPEHDAENKMFRVPKVIG